MKLKTHVRQIGTYCFYYKKGNYRIVQNNVEKPGTTQVGAVPTSRKLFFPLKVMMFFFAFSAENRVLAGGSRMFPDLIAMVISCHDISMAFHTNLDMVMAIKWHDYHGCHETWYHHDMVVLEDCQELSGNHRNSHGNYYFEKCSFAICFTPENALKIW